MLNLYIFDELNNWLHIPTNNFTLKNYLFSTVKLTRNADKIKFTYNGQGIPFDVKTVESFDNRFAGNVVILGVDNTSSSHIDNPNNNFLVDEGSPESINASVGAAENILLLTLLNKMQNLA